uniref:Zinc finger protein 516 n=1 Tax=Hucho hucho TaxID=62062 RepID=A0A4W5P3L4_9TELE
MSYCREQCRSTVSELAQAGSGRHSTMNPRESGGGGVEAMETQAGGLELGEEGGKASHGGDGEGGGEDKASAYDCNVCGRSFPFQSSLSQHMRRHTGARPYKCPYCDHRASQKGNLKVHIRSHKLRTLTSHHPEEEEGPEEEEDGSGEVGVSEGLDGGTSPTKSSSACNRVVNGDANAEESIGKTAVRSVKREKSSSDQRPYCCRLCGYQTQREDQLLSHIEKVHITADMEDETTQVSQEAVATEGEAETQVTDGAFPCETCGQVFTQAWFLKSHMKKHAGLLEHCCRVCGRRFREAWFLKSHMKTHNGSKASGRGKPKADSQEAAATINDVAQDPETNVTSTSLYQVCSKCGNLFHDQESLRAHEKIHSQAKQLTQGQRRPSDDGDSLGAKRRLLDYLSLRPAVEEKPQEEKRRLGQRIPELDPVCSYQAWQLATRGRVLEPVEAYSIKATAGEEGDEALAGGTVVYEKESSRYILEGQERERRSGRRSSASGGGGSSHHTSPGERTPESLSDSEYRPSSRQGRRSSSSQQIQSKSTECFECGKVFRSRHQMIVHQRVHQRRDGGRGSGSGGDNRAGQGGDRWGSTSDPESGSPSRPSTPGYGNSPPASTLGEDAPEMGTANAVPLADEKSYVCSLCDFVSTESSAFLSHLRLQHTSDGRPIPKPSSSSERGTPSSFPKLKRALLHRLAQSSAPHPYLSARPSRDKCTAESSSLSDSHHVAPLDLCVRAEGHRGPASSALQQKGLPSHKCSYCSHSTRYLEVLWMHQTVAHRINSSALAPKWALLKNGFKGPREGSSSRRRTGPPPALDGRQCPPFPLVVRTPRTRPPSLNGGQKKDSRDRAASQPSTSSSSSSSSSTQGSSSSASGSQSVQPPRAGSSRQRGEAVPDQGQRSRSNSRPRVEIYPRGGSSTGSLEKSTAAGAPQRPSAPSPSVGGTTRLVERYMLPQEGLGFMLSSKHGLAEYSRARSSPQPQPKPRSSQSHTQSHPLSQGRPRAERPAHNTTMAGQGYGASHSQTHGSAVQVSSTSSSNSSSAQRAEVKQEEARGVETPELPMDILSFLKNCNSNDLATLYHRWGAANPQLDPTGMLRSLVRQGEYACQECGKSFSQPSHLRTHMRSHTVVFDYNGLRGADAQTNSSEAPKQVCCSPRFTLDCCFPFLMHVSFVCDVFVCVCLHACMFAGAPVLIVLCSFCHFHYELCVLLESSAFRLHIFLVVTMSPSH